MHDEPVSPSGSFKRIALTMEEVKRLGAAGLAAHIQTLGQSRDVILTCALGYLWDKPDVLFGLLRYIGLLKPEPQPVSPTEPE